MFNTFSQHTKERRRSGFEDFLKLVVAIDPLPPEMEDFLELEDHLSNLGKDRSPMRPVPFDSERSSSGGKRPQMKESSYSRDSAYASVVGGATSTKQEYIPSSMQPAHSTEEQTESNNKKSAKLELRNILLSTFAVTTVIYALCIYIGVINISQSSQGNVTPQHAITMHHPQHIWLNYCPLRIMYVGRVVLTALSLGSTFSLLRISARRRQLRAKASSTQSPHSDK